MTFADVTGTPISAVGTLNLYTDPSDGDYSYDSEANLLPPYAGTTYPDQGDFPGFGNITNPNTQGWWEMTVRHPNGSVLSQGLLNFNQSGALNATPGSDGVVDIELSNIDWFNGSELQDIDIDIERFSQFAGNYDVIFSDQNGAELGLRTGVDLTRDGYVVARFSNGATANLYKVPLVTFANANGLQEVSGTAYTENSLSGEENLREAGTGGAGFLEPSTVETSNVDLADEFAKLIVSQRAFSANTRVINTVDQMTEDLLRLR
jgi:flagellar hook protein FlgE